MTSSLSFSEKEYSLDRNLGFPDNSSQDNSSRTTRRGQLVAGQFVADNSSRTILRRTIRRGQLVADNSSQDNSSRTTRRGQFVAKYNINFIESTASISATFFSLIPLPLQQHYFHHS